MILAAETGQISIHLEQTVELGLEFGLVFSINSQWQLTGRHNKIRFC